MFLAGNGARPVPGMIGWIHLFPPLFSDVDQKHQQDHRTDQLQAVLHGTANGAGHGKFKDWCVDHCQLHKVFIPYFDTALVNGFRHKLVAFRGLGFRHPLQPVGMQSGKTNNAVFPAGQLTVDEPFRSAGTLCGIHVIGVHHRLPYGSIRGPFQEEFCSC